MKKLSRLVSRFVSIPTNGFIIETPGNGTSLDGMIALLCNLYFLFTCEGNEGREEFISGLITGLDSAKRRSSLGRAPIRRTMFG